jgi:hypothetical protein
VKDLSHSRLLEVLSYNPETGVFHWRIALNGRVRAGDVAGSTHASGYRNISIDKGRYQAHRLAWFYVHGTWPQSFIDHKDGVRSDNRIANIRPATRLQNNRNRPLYKNSTVSLKGVRKLKKGYQARIQVEGRSIALGAYPTAREAYSAYKTASVKYFGTFSRESLQ